VFWVPAAPGLPEESVVPVVPDLPAAPLLLPEEAAAWPESLPLLEVPPDEFALPVPV